MFGESSSPLPPGRWRTNKTFKCTWEAHPNCLLYHYYLCSPAPPILFSPSSQLHSAPRWSRSAFCLTLLPISICKAHPSNTSQRHTIPQVTKKGYGDKPEPLQRTMAHHNGLGHRWARSHFLPKKPRLPSLEEPAEVISSDQNHTCFYKQ